MPAAAGKGYQVLLQGIPPEDMGDFKLAHFAFRSLRVKNKFIVFVIKSPGEKESLCRLMAENDPASLYRAMPDKSPFALSSYGAASTS